MTNDLVIPPSLERRFAKHLRSLERRWNTELPEFAIKVNPRLTRTVARFIPGTVTVELSPSALHLRPAQQLEILSHEAAHAVVWQRHGRLAKPHGLEWAGLIRAAGHQPTASLVRCAVLAASKEVRASYRHTCQVCHFSAIAARRMSNWRCPECAAIGLPGMLSIERLS